MARRHWMLLAGIVAFGLSPLSAPAGHAEEPRDKIERPERGISMHTEYSRVTIPMGEKVRMDLTIDNRGKHDENVLVNLVSVPRGWKAGVKGGQYEVSGVPVEATKTRVLTFTAESNIIDVYVGYLRRKIDAEGEPRLPHTVRGAGYMLRGEE